MTWASNERIKSINILVNGVDATSEPANLFVNGLHQVELTVNATFENGSTPSSDEMYEAIQLLDYNTGGSLNVLETSKTKGSYCNVYNPSETSDSAIATMASADNLYTATYYVDSSTTKNPGNQNETVSLSFTIPGGEDSSFWAGGEGEFEVQANIQCWPEKKYKIDDIALNRQSSSGFTFHYQGTGGDTYDNGGFSVYHMIINNDYYNFHDVSAQEDTQFVDDVCIGITGTENTSPLWNEWSNIYDFTHSQGMGAKSYYMSVYLYETASGVNVWGYYDGTVNQASGEYIFASSNASFETSDWDDNLLTSDVNYDANDQFGNHALIVISVKTGGPNLNTVG
ncbi:hypothetical protein [Rahnella contaminans]|uniref:hypothetical protein n=1 Tax=Rahnella contaminans TaxID=2703882 RepID=UPI003C2B4632